MHCFQCNGWQTDDNQHVFLVLTCAVETHTHKTECTEAATFRQFGATVYIHLSFGISSIHLCFSNSAHSIPRVFFSIPDTNSSLLFLFPTDTRFQPFRSNSAFSFPSAFFSILDTYSAVKLGTKLFSIVLSDKTAAMTGDYFDKSWKANGLYSFIPLSPYFCNHFYPITVIRSIKELFFILWYMIIGKKTAIATYTAINPTAGTKVK